MNNNLVGNTFKCANTLNVAAIFFKKINNKIVNLYNLK